MKLSKYIWLAALPMLFTACQEDIQVEQSQKQGIYTLSCAMAGPDSRAQVMLGNQKDNVEYFQWNEGDKLNVIQQDAASTKLIQHEFSISEDYSNDYPTRTADFITTNPLTSINPFVAFYPNVGITTNTNDRIKIKLDNTITDYSDESWTAYFNKNMFMIGEGVVNDQMEPTNVTFKHLCSMFRITYTNQTTEDKVLKGILTDAPYCHTMEYRLFYAEVNAFQQGWEASGKVGLNFSNDVTIAPNESKDFYILFFPYSPYHASELMTKVGVKYANSRENYTPTYKEAKKTDLPVFAAGTRYWFKISETENGLVWDDTSQAQTVLLPNPELSMALQDMYGEENVVLMPNGHGVMKKEFADALTVLDFSGYENQKNITSLKGIDVFSNLEELYCSDSSLTGELKFYNRKLRRLDVSSNNLTYIEVNDLSELEYLNCSNNPNLGNGIIIAGTRLKELIFHHTGANNQAFIMQNYDVSTIENFDCGDNKFKSLDFTGYSSLKSVHASCNQLTSDKFVLPASETLIWLDLTLNSNITYIDLTQYPNLEYFYNQQNNVETLDVSKCPNLYLLYTNGNRMQELDLTQNKKLEHLFCDGQQNDIVLKLKLPEELMDRWNNEWKDSFYNVQLDESTSGGDSEETITIENPSFAQELKNQFGDDVTLQDGKAIMLKSFVESKDELWFWGVQSLTSLEGIKNFTNLQKLVLVYHNVSSLDVSGLKSLKVLECWEGTLESLDITGCTALEELYCQKNKLLSLDLTGCTNITKLNCEDNKLTSLDMTGCTKEEIDLLCGNQGAKIDEEITITVKLTEAMMDYWKKYLHDAGNNSVRVSIEGLEDSVVAPSIGKENW